MEQQKTWNFIYWLLAVLALLSIQGLWRASQHMEPVAYSEFEHQLSGGHIAEVTVADRVITGRLKEPRDGKTAIVAARGPRHLGEVSAPV